MIPPTGAVTCAMHIVDGLMIAHSDEILATWNQGCIELFQEVGQYAQLCHDLFEETYNKTQDAPGVYDYEVSYEFGAWFGLMIRTEHAPSQIEADAKLRELAAKFWSQINQIMNRRATNVS